jgi:DNA-binding phage protein
MRTRYILAMDIGIMSIETMDILAMDTEIMDFLAKDAETMDAGTMEAEAMGIKARVKGITDIGTATGVEQKSVAQFLLNSKYSKYLSPSH